MSTSMVGEVAVVPAAGLRGELHMPGDKSMTHRALLLAGMAAGRSIISDASAALDPRSTAACMAALGVAVDRVGDADGRAIYHVDSPGIAAWMTPTGVLDCGNSGTTLRMLAGALAGSNVRATLDGDASLRARPVARIVAPLRAMGADIRARADHGLPPVSIVGGAPLHAIEHESKVPSAQVKSAVLLAGLAAEGTTIVREAVATRDHTERMLRARGVAVTVDAGPGAGAVVRLEGGQAVGPIDERIAGDVSSAMFWLVAGACHPDARLTLSGVGVNPTRRAAVDLLRTMGASIDIVPVSDGEPSLGMEPVADLTVASSHLTAIELSAPDVAAAIDEIPALCLAAAYAEGTTRIRGAGELRHKESDRLTGVAEGLNALGAHVTIEGDDLVIQGGGRRSGFRLRGGDVQARDDHRLAMTFAVAGLLAAGPVRFDGRSVAISYPTFFRDLERIRA